jgi:hypothetical protein
MNRTLHILAWGVAGTVLTGALTGAAIVVAGNDIAMPVRPFSLTSERLVQPTHVAEPNVGLGHERDPGGIGEVGQPGDDQVGDGASGSSSGPGSGSSGSSSDEGSGDLDGLHDGNGGDDDD